MSFREEGPPDGVFHDPSWPERWSHEGFNVPTGVRKRRWHTQPWYDDNSRLAANFIHHSITGSWPCGYVIYRTVYTPESDTQCPAALDKFDRYMHHEIDAELQDEEEEMDAYPERLVHEAYRNVVFCEKDRFDGASIRQIRQHFNQWRESHRLERGTLYSPGLTRYNVWLVVDEKALASLIRAPEPGKKNHGDPRGYCTMVTISLITKSLCLWKWGISGGIILATWESASCVHLSVMASSLYTTAVMAWLLTRMARSLNSIDEDGDDYAALSHV